MAEKNIYSLTENLDTGLRYAVWGRAEKFPKKRHTYKVWRTLKGFSCIVYPVAPDLKRWENAKVYPDLALLKDKVDVVIPCLLPEEIPDLVVETAAAGAKKIWFQEKNCLNSRNNGCPRHHRRARMCLTRKRASRSGIKCKLSPSHLFNRFPNLTDRSLFFDRG